MAFSKTPTDWIPGIAHATAGSAVAENSLVIPMTSLPELTQAELTGSGADIRRVLFAISEAVFQSWNNKPTADRPVRMTLSRTTTVNDALGVTNRNYAFAFAIESASVEVAPEPV